MIWKWVRDNGRTGSSADNVGGRIASHSLNVGALSVFIGVTAQILVRKVRANALKLAFGVYKAVSVRDHPCVFESRGKTGETKLSRYGCEKLPRFRTVHKNTVMRPYQRHQRSKNRRCQRIQQAVKPPLGLSFQPIGVHAELGI